MLHGKAKILAKLGEKAGAKEAAVTSIAAAQTAGGAAAAEYKRLNEALLATGAAPPWTERETAVLRLVRDHEL